MANGDHQPIRKGDRGFVLRLAGGVGVFILLAALVLGLLTRSALIRSASPGPSIRAALGVINLESSVPIAHELR